MNAYQKADKSALVARVNTLTNNVRSQAGQFESTVDEAVVSAVWLVVAHGHNPAPIAALLNAIDARVAVSDSKARRQYQGIVSSVTDWLADHCPNGFRQKNGVWGVTGKTGEYTMDHYRASLSEDDHRPSQYVSPAKQAEASARAERAKITREAKASEKAAQEAATAQEVAEARAIKADAVASVKALEARIAELIAMVAERDQIIAELRTALESKPSRKAKAA